MNDFLLEIYTDEIPAKILNPTIDQLKESFQKYLKEFKINAGEVKAYGTMKRLIIYVDKIDEREEDSELEIKGPSLKSAIDENGNKLPSFCKFLEANKIREDAIFIKELKGNKYVFGIKKVHGKTSEEIMTEVSIKSLSSLTFPRTMRWNETNTRFIRPVRNILALLGSKLIDLSFAGIKSGNLTFGFYFDSPMEILVKSPEDYFIKLREKYIIYDFNERKRIVEQKIKMILNKINGIITDDKEFLEELINLTEFPTPILCSFEDIKTNIPDCVVESVVKDHMKALPITKKDGNRLLPYFIVIKNGTSDFTENVRKGYEKVVKARILDGEFFFNEDRKKRLSDRFNELEQVVFMRNLGSMKDKTNRLVTIGEHISRILKYSSEKKNNLKRAAMLSKCDLVTNIVREFPELQGKIGGIYASLDGENNEVSRAIEDHYLPRFQNDRLPESDLGKLLSIIDRVDTIVGSILSSVEFSSSKDPFGIRKTTSGIIEILCRMNNISHFPLKELIMKTKEVYFEQENKLNGDINNVYSLIYDRAESFLRENSIDYDISNALIKLNLDELPTFLERAKLLMKHRHEQGFELLCQAHKRVRNILSKAEFEEKPVDNNYLFDEAEIKLNNIINESWDLLPSLLASRDFDAVIHMFYLLNPEVKKFFENVLVMDENKKIRYNRLNLLLRLKNLYEKFASFSEIVINENKDKA